ncbi:MAG TPA: hypothetical protein VJX30_11595, partial [Terriglobales bacterium]|nr:hypothetical protein [Terriglobales bacterium]
LEQSSVGLRCSPGHGSVVCALDVCARSAGPAAAQSKMTAQAMRKALTELATAAKSIRESRAVL